MKSKLSIIGTGNLAQHLIKAFYDKAEIVQIIGRNISTLSKLKKEFSLHCASLDDEILPSDLYLLCISDHAIHSVAERMIPRIPSKDALLCHTSGTTSLHALSDHWPNTGIIWPIQSFTAQRSLKYADIPFCVTASNNQVARQLLRWVHLISPKSFILPDPQRKHLHLAAVVINNHINHLLYLTKVYCQNHDIPFQQLLPLLDETIQKAKEIGPEEAQTGPARRQDDATLTEHQELLDHYPIFQELYTLISESINLTYHHENY